MASGNKRNSSKAKSKSSSKSVKNKSVNNKARTSKAGTNKARTSRESTEKGRQFDEKDMLISNDIKIISSFVIMVLLTLSNFGIMGTIGNTLSSVMFGIFGLIAYVAPIIIFIGICFVIANLGSRKAMRLIKGFIALFISLCTFLQLIYSSVEDNFVLGEVYKTCSEIKNGGGIIGGLFAVGLYKVIGIYGAFIVDIATIIISMVILSEKSFVNHVKTKSKNAYDGAREDIKRMKENNALREEKREAAKRPRTEKKVRGVNMGINLAENSETKADVKQLVEDGILYQGHIEENVYEEPDILTRFRENQKRIMSEKEQPVSRQTAGNVNAGNVGANIGTGNRSAVNDVLKQAEQEKIDQDVRNGEFTPKERIYLSKEAKEVMRRPAFPGMNMGGGSRTASSVNAGSAASGSMASGSIASGSGTVAASPVSPAASASMPKEIPISYEAPDVEKAVTKEAVSAAMAGPGIKSKEYVMPPISLLKKGTKFTSNVGNGVVSETAVKLQETLNAFGVKATVINESRGPSVTRYELQPETGTKVSKITSLSDDIKLNLAASDIRIEAPIPGKAAVGIEVPNAKRESVLLRELIESEELKKHPSKLAFAAGMDIAGKVVVADIAKMPHMLVAGTTGSGKSVFTNSIIMSILFRAKPSEVKLIIVDPKVVEFGVYNGIPHLLTPVVTDPRKAAGALNWAVGEMQERYKLFAEYSVRDLKGYNEKIKNMNYKDGDRVLETKPQIVIIIDELADLMMVASKEVEASICRLAQLARAAGIHLIIATQRPSVDVVTGLIKANIPSRVSLLVSSGVDSRTVIDCNGGEKLLGNGDMLFYPSGYVKPVRLQGAFVSDEEVINVTQFIINNNMDVKYDEKVAESQEVAAAPANSGTPGQQGSQNDEDERDVLYEQAARFVIEKEKASTSMLQRMFKIGFNRAARIIDSLESDGVVGSDEGTKPRKVLMTMGEFEAFLRGEEPVRSYENKGVNENSNSKDADYDVDVNSGMDSDNELEEDTDI